MVWRDHPILKPPTAEEMAVMEPEDLQRLHKLYHEAIGNSERDPYRYGFVLPNWLVAEELLSQVDAVLALGGNRGAKTQLGAWMTVKCAMANEGSLIVCFAQNAELSVLVQQAAIFHHLPVEYKQKTLGQEEYISYTKQNGFAGNSIIFPNGSRILFKTYSQFQQNQTVLEGLELGAFSPKAVNLGAWCDEYLGGPELINTLSFRLATRNAKMLLTFTPIEGYSETVRIYLDGAKTERTKTAELLGGRQVPYVQRCKDRDAAIVYLHTKDNPFSGYERVAKEAAAKGDESWVLCRLYGIPTKSISSKFPSFSRETNVIPHDKLPWIADLFADVGKGSKPSEYTHYMVLDPAGRKKWFMAWIAVDASETWWVYREWPDVSVGDWAEWKNGKWSPGEGAKRDGQVEGVNQYADLIRQIERDAGVSVFERLIDPRLGAAKYQSMTGSSSIIEDLADAGLVFLPAPGIEIDDGLQALHNKMAYDKKRPIDGNNRPRFYISDRCENIIRALQEYTGDEGKDEAWKDAIDVIRYAAVAEIRYIHPKWLNAGGGAARGAY
jgi:hypothetical protein